MNIPRCSFPAIKAVHVGHARQRSLNSSFRQLTSVRAWSPHASRRNLTSLGCRHAKHPLLSTPSAIRSLNTSHLSSVPSKSLNTESRRHYTSDIGVPLIHSFLERNTSTWQYLVVDPSTSEGVIIDTVLDFDVSSGTIMTTTADSILDFIELNGIKILRILETHAHADHLTASQYFKQKLGGNVPVCIGHRITQVQKSFAPVYGLESTALAETFDIFLRDEEEFKIGELSCRVIHLPGHTPDHVGYVVGKAVFTGDSIFLPDVGSARADFPGGNAKDLYDSIQRLLSLPENYELFVGHDYPEGREHNCVTTVGEQLKLNKHSKAGTTEAGFIKFREARDAVLGAPKLLHPSLQVNIRAGKFPPPDANGRILLKIPLKTVPV